jgi:predicted RNA-binding protein with TRAM domain
MEESVTFVTDSAEVVMGSEQFTEATDYDRIELLGTQATDRKNGLTVPITKGDNTEVQVPQASDQLGGEANLEVVVVIEEMEQDDFNFINVTADEEELDNEAEVVEVDVSHLLSYPSEANKENSSPTEHDTPGRGHLRLLASASQELQAARMQKRFWEDTIQDVPIGGVCLVFIDKVDRSKIDPRCLPCVVVEVTPRIQYRLACKAGILDHVLCRQDFLYEPQKTPIFYGLQDALQNLRAMNKVSFRAGSAAVAPSGGQGHVHCSCSGACNSKR